MERVEFFDTAYGGYGVGKISDGRVVFVPFTVTGDIADIEIVEDKKSFCYGKLVNLIEESDKRSEPYCPIIGECGGCLFGHIDYKEQIEIKKKILKDSFKKKLKIDIEPEVLYDEQLEYRNRAVFKIQGGKPGFYKFMTNEFLACDRCRLIDPKIIKKVNEFCEDLPSNTEDFELYCVSNEDGEVLAEIKKSKYIKISGKGPFDGFKCGKSIYGKKEITQMTAHGEILTSFSCFLQSNRNLFKQFQKYAVTGAKGQCLELYAGSGYFTKGLIDSCDIVTAVEFAGTSLDLGKKSLTKKVIWRSGNADRVVTKLDKKFDTVLVDPPRTGLSKPVRKYIKDLAPETFIYVSCTPDTLVRDLGVIIENYEITDIKMFDMFPNTYHVETVVKLKRKS
jgi:23S rRNA (uracil1939-C5)-methyltransferase